MTLGAPRPLLSALALLALASPLAGCAEPDVQESTDEGDYLLAGRLAENVTEEQVEEMGLQAEPLGAQVLVMESFPMRYQVRPLDAQECADMRAWLAQRPYVDIVSECYPVRDPLEPEAVRADAPWWVPDEDRGEGGGGDGRGDSRDGDAEDRGA